jgi:hypothetical protein
MVVPVHRCPGLLHHVHYLPTTSHDLDEEDWTSAVPFRHLFSLGMCDGECCLFRAWFSAHITRLDLALFRTGQF